MSKALESLRYDVLGSKPSLISLKKNFKTLVLYKSESLGQRAGKEGFH